MTRARRRIVLAGCVSLALVLVFFARPLFLMGRAWLRDHPAHADLERGFADDASRLNRTRVAEIVPVAADEAVAERQIRDLFVRARRDHLHVSIAGAKHSMGGHTIAPDGIVLDMLAFRHIDVDVERRILHVGAGARWSEVLRAVDEGGLSVGVMQSNDDFSVGGSISVNCHGWQAHAAPIASTVDSFRILLADGRILRCSRGENHDLFALALGGYGLFGVILDVDLRLVPNQRLRVETVSVDADDYVKELDARVTTAPDVALEYGRLCVVPGESFLRAGLLTTFTPEPGPIEKLSALGDPNLASLRRIVYRAQIESDAGKALRWDLETRFGEQLSASSLTRNQVLAESATIYMEQNQDRVEIIQEYFVPPESFAHFVADARAILERRRCDLLNVTVRDVEPDDDTFLRYADRRMIAVVFLIDTERTTTGDAVVQALARELIDTALTWGGRYYLPYRLYASREQFERAYPLAPAFFEAKRRYDPDGLFQNRFSLQYGPP
jgi:FAD/FMN-containing dehydrogenase